MTVKQDAAMTAQALSAFGLEGATCVVLGAGQNMGHAAASALALAGGRVVCVDISQEHAASAAADVGGIALTADVTDRLQMAAVFEDAKRLVGEVDVIADVVGMARWLPLGETSDELWQAQFDLCLRHAYLTLQLAPAVMSAGGAVTFVSSISGITGAPGHAAYGAAKAALGSLVKSAAVELAPRSIRVNAVAPGLVKTDRFEQTILTQPGRLEALNADIPLGRLGTPEEIADVTLFLSSHLARYVTGQTLVVDGGITAQLQWRP